MWQLAPSLPFMFFPALCVIGDSTPDPPAIFNQPSPGSRSSGRHPNFHFPHLTAIATEENPDALESLTDAHSNAHVFAINEQSKDPRAVHSCPRLEQRGPPEHTKQAKLDGPPPTPSKRPPTSNKAPRRQAPARAMAIMAATAARCLQALESLQNPPCRQRGWGVPSHPCHAFRGRSRSQ